MLWYAKPALTQDMPPKLLAYREVDPTFPRVSTINQFFHLAQFEAYRDLGRYNGRRIRIARRQLATATATHPEYSGLPRLGRAGRPRLAGSTPSWSPSSSASPTTSPPPTARRTSSGSTRQVRDTLAARPTLTRRL